MNNIRFLGNDLPFVSYENSRVVIVPAPLEKTVSYGTGTGNGPQAVLTASQFVELYDEEFNAEPSDVGIYTDAEIPNTLSQADFLQQLETRCLSICRDKKIPVIIGGEHSLSIAPIRALKTIYSTDFSVLQFDAHTDLRYEYEHSTLSHASVMRRVFEENIPGVAVGIRSLCKEEAEFIDQNNLHIIYAKDIHQNNDWLSHITSWLSENIYITFDVDVFDPSIISHTGTPEPGGLNWYQILSLLEHLRKGKKQLLGMDVVEYAPKNNHEAQSFTCAKLIYKAIAHFTCGTYQSAARFVPAV